MERIGPRPPPPRPHTTLTLSWVASPRARRTPRTARAHREKDVRSRRLILGVQGAPVTLGSKPRQHRTAPNNRPLSWRCRVGRAGGRFPVQAFRGIPEAAAEANHRGSAHRDTEPHLVSTHALPRELRLRTASWESRIQLPPLVARRRAPPSSYSMSAGLKPDGVRLGMPGQRLRPASEPNRCATRPRHPPGIHPTWRTVGRPGSGSLRREAQQRGRPRPPIFPCRAPRLRRAFALHQP